MGHSGARSTRLRDLRLKAPGVVPSRSLSRVGVGYEQLFLLVTPSSVPGRGMVLESAPGTVL